MKDILINIFYVFFVINPVMAVLHGYDLHANLLNLTKEVQIAHPLYSGLSFEDWLAHEEREAIKGLKKNLSTQGVSPGAVTASPSRGHPDYFYHWVRDASIVAGTVLDLYERADDEKERFSDEQFLKDFTHFSRTNQLTPNRSGGLGEPKFNVDGTAFNAEWGRPQNDGPALRAITLIRWAGHLLRRGQIHWVRSQLYDGLIPTHTVIKADLEFISHHWMEPSFDLWEEVYGQHFYTRMVQRKALLDGAALADELGDHAAALWYRGQASSLKEVILRHWNASQGLFQVTLDQQGGISSKSSGLDIGVLLGVLHGSQEDRFLSVSDDRVLSTAFQLRRAFQKLYHVNAVHELGVAVGRYPEDMYDGYEVSVHGGNPWVLATLALGEFYYRVALEWEQQGSVRVTELNLPFLLSLSEVEWRTPHLSLGEVVGQSDPQFQEWLRLLQLNGDLQLRRVQYHSPASGQLFEQMNRDTGFMQGAPDLAWSYASFLSALWVREKL